MNSLRRLSIALVCLGAAGLSVHAATITGTVVDAGTRAPKGSMVVEAYDRNGAIAGTATTDATGKYTIVALSAGDYRVLAYDNAGIYATAFDGDADSYDTTPFRTLSLSSLLTVNFALQKGGSVSGRVQTSSGGVPSKPVVAAYNLSGTRRGFTKPAADGTYNIVLPPGVYKLVAWDDAGVYGSSFYLGQRSFVDATPLRVDAGNTIANRNFTLDRAAHFTGTVVDGGTAQPLAAMFVFAYTDSGAFVAGTATNSVGAFDLNLSPGAYRFVAADPDRGYATSYYADSRSFASSRIEVLAAGETRRDVRIALARAATVNGRVTDDSGAPLHDMTIDAYNDDGTLHASALTDADGRYSLVVAPGQVRIVASDRSLTYAKKFYLDATTFDAATALAATADATLSAIDFTLLRAGRITGTVRNAVTTGAIGAMTVAAYDDAGVEIERTKTGADGRYLLAVPPGSYRVIAFDESLVFANAFAGEASSYEAIAPLVVTEGSAVSADFSMRRGAKVAGQVTDSTGAPLSGIDVFAVDSSGNRVGGATTQNGAYTLVAPVASVTFQAVDPRGHYSVQFYPGVPTLSQSTFVLLTAGQSPFPASFTMQSPGRRRGVRH